MKRIKFIALLLLGSFGSCLQCIAAEKVYEADVCVYGGTASGIAAALAAQRRGEKVIIVEPMRFLGGIPGGGISISMDCRYSDDIGGIAKELHDADSYGGLGDQWELRLMFKKKVEEAGIQYFTEYRLDSKEDVVMKGTTIEKIYLNYAPIMDEGVPPPKPSAKHVFAVKAKVYIDAGYEGDLMAFSGVDYTLGREAKSTYNESLAGQRGLQVFNVDPYIEKGNPASGLLPMISSEPYEEGAASRYCMAYNFRLMDFKTNVNKNKRWTLLRPLEREVDKEKYALVIRALEDSPKSIDWPTYNYSRNSMVSSSIPGRQADYADSNWAERSAIWREFIDHVKTMNVLKEIKNFSLPAGRYPTNGGFPDQLYIRLGRRMVSDYVVTQDDLMYQTKVDDSVGLAYYGVDIYPARLIAYKGKVASEGETFVRVSPGPYPISNQALRPKKDQVDNLIVSVCISSSHVAMASIRMESGYVVLGEAAGIVASHVVKSGQKVQDVDFAPIRADMKESGVITRWNEKGYGPDAKGPWSNFPNTIYWKTHPEEYKKIPLRLDPSWTKSKSTGGR